MMNLNKWAWPVMKRKRSSSICSSSIQGAEDNRNQMMTEDDDDACTIIPDPIRPPDPKAFGMPFSLVYDCLSATLLCAWDWNAVGTGFSPGNPANPQTIEQRKRCFPSYLDFINPERHQVYLQTPKELNASVSGQETYVSLCEQMEKDPDQRVFYVKGSKVFDTCVQAIMLWIARHYHEATCEDDDHFPRHNDTKREKKRVAKGGVMPVIDVHDSTFAHSRDFNPRKILQFTAKDYETVSPKMMGDIANYWSRNAVVTGY